MAEDDSAAVALVEPNTRPMGVVLVNSKKTNKPSDCMDIVDLARQVQKADEFVKANVSNKLTVIVDQIKYLQEQARKALQKASVDADLHHAACNMVKKPGNVYYLYQRSSNQKYLSLVSPEEWGASCPHEFLGGFRLEYDMSWTPVQEIARRDSEMATINTIIGAHAPLTELPSSAVPLPGLLPSSPAKGHTNMSNGPCEQQINGAI